MELFLLAILMAIGVLIVEAFSEDLAWMILTISFLAVVLPIVVIYLLGVSDMLSADPETARVIADGTIASIVSYVADKLPGVALADAAGILIGTGAALLTGEEA